MFVLLYKFYITDDVKSAEPIRRIEVWLDDAQWWLTQDDGQLHMCDITFTNCRYNFIACMCTMNASTSLLPVMEIDISNL